MTFNVSKLANMAAALTLLIIGLVLVTVIFPNQIPEGLDGDVSSGQYPRFIMFIWVLSSGGWFVSALAGHMDRDGDSKDSWVSKRSFAIMAVVAVGYAVFATVGFLTAGFILIVALSHICGERGAPPWVLGAVVPPCVYLFLDILLDVTLPTIFFG